MARWLWSAMIAVSANVAAAHACPPPAPPPPPMYGESVEAYEARMAAQQAEGRATQQARMLAHQQSLWAQSESVLVARLVRVSTFDGEPFFYSPRTRVRLQPVRTLKGRESRNTFTLADTGMTSCGPVGTDAGGGAVGDEFVVYVRRGRPRQSSILDAISLERIADPLVRGMLDAASE